MTTTFIVALLIASFSGFSSIAYAQQQPCTSTTINLSLGYDGGVGDMNVKSGKACRIGLGSNNFLPSRIELVTQPRFGKIIVHSLNTWSYVSNAKYKGSDEFKILYIGQLNSPHTGMSTGTVGTSVTYKVTVVP